LRIIRKIFHKKQNYHSLIIEREKIMSIFSKFLMDEMFDLVAILKALFMGA